MINYILFIFLLVSCATSKPIIYDNSGRRIDRLFSLSSADYPEMQIRQDKFITAKEEITAAAKEDSQDMLSLYAIAKEDLHTATKIASHFNIKNLNDTESKDSLEAYYSLAVLTARLKKYNKALIYIKKIINAKNQKMEAKALNLLGAIYASKGEHTIAASYWDEALKQDSTLEETHLNLGVLYLKYGQYKKSKWHLSKVKKYVIAQVGLVRLARVLKENLPTDYCATIDSKYLKNKMITILCQAP